MIEANLQKYIAFVKTVELGSLSKAAQALSYSQSGISRMLQDLEREWNITLLERDRAGVRLTSDGMRLLPYAQRLCGEYYKMQEQIEEISGLKSGLIRIGTFSSVATHWLPKMIGSFQAEYPGIDYELLLGDYSEIEQWIAEGRVDCGFLRLPTRKEFVSMHLAADEQMVVLPKTHPLAAAERFPVKALDGAEFMLLQKGGDDDVSVLLQENNVKPHIKFTTWDDYAIMSMVEQGFGISILPRLILQRIPYDICIKPLDRPIYRQIGIAMRSENVSAAMQKFLQYVTVPEAK